mmetsp:Transcript_16095/g.18044  ORF Transcript_16095/g.18044 Transcript_16095/m.18044 type:complete len:401 (+) Transcript_16095:35-1237(+)
MMQPETPASITFIATSNNVTATENQRDKVPLRQVISNSEAFHKAFEQKNTKLVNSPEIIQSSSDECSSAGNLVHAARYGLVSAIMDAYNTHHCLVLRPDDIWQAILTQFSFYVNANAEDLRDAFVDFQGKKTLVIEMQGSLFAADFAATFANRMVDEQIATNLKDPEVTAWLLPHFSTTQPADRVVASVTIMSTLQAYFDYVCCLMCGIPEVTLEGTVDDWRWLRQKIDRLPQYDIQGNDPVMAKWHTLLVPVLDEFVTSAAGHPDLAFWDRVCSHSGGGSGPSYLSGWVTVFACFKATGQWMGDVVPGGLNEKPKQWPRIDTDSLPVGVVSVPVLVDDNGTQYDTQMVAGQFAYEMALGQQSSNLDTVRPRNDWCLAYEGTPKSEPRAYQPGEIRSVGA